MPNRSVPGEPETCRRGDRSPRWRHLRAASRSAVRPRSSARDGARRGHDVLYVAPPFAGDAERSRGAQQVAASCAEHQGDLTTGHRVEGRSGAAPLPSVLCGVERPGEVVAAPAHTRAWGGPRGSRAGAAARCHTGLWSPRGEQGDRTPAEPDMTHTVNRMYENAGVSFRIRYRHGRIPAPSDARVGKRGLMLTSVSADETACRPEWIDGPLACVRGSRRWR
jgi:hypothetical protein